jgi:flagellar biosynthesis/type III secretory pathway M-ring protein FliF/YscJ
MAAAVAGFAASRMLPIPKPILIVAGIIFAIAVLWLCGRAFIRRRREKREDHNTAWATFNRDRNVS